MGIMIEFQKFHNNQTIAMNKEENKKVKDILYYKSEKIACRGIMCPACKIIHDFDDSWKFNGDYYKPTFRPSMLWKPHDDKSKLTGEVCHSWVTNGKIQFLGDCTHELKGQTVDLLDFLTNNSNE